MKAPSVLGSTALAFLVMLSVLLAAVLSLSVIVFVAAVPSTGSAVKKQNWESWALRDRNYQCFCTLDDRIIHHNTAYGRDAPCHYRCRTTEMCRG